MSKLSLRLALLILAALGGCRQAEQPAPATPSAPPAPVSTPTTDLRAAVQARVNELWEEGAGRYQRGDNLGAIELWEQALELDPTNDAIREKVARVRAGQTVDGTPQPPAEPPIRPTVKTYPPGAGPR